MLQVPRTFPIAAIVLFCSAVSVAQPLLHLAQNFGPPTSNLSLGGQGFSPNALLSIDFDQQQVGQAMTDSSGAFSNVAVKVPANALPGPHDVIAVDPSLGTVQVCFNVETAWAEFGFTSGGDRNNYLENVLNPSNVSQLVEYFNFTTSHTGAITPPAISHGLVFFGSTDHHVYAFDAVTGRYVWNYATLSEVITSGAAVYNGIVYIGSEDGFVYALDAASGHLRWKFDAGFLDAIWSSPTVVNGVVYVGGGTVNMDALDARRGTLLWTFTSGDFISCAPAVSNGIVYFTAYDNNVYAVNASDGKLVWKVPTAYSLLQVSPAVAYGKVFVPALDGTYAFDAGTGALIWKNPAVQGGDQSPAVANGVLYIAGFEITALNANSGQVLWRNRSEYFDTSPVVANGVVYVGGTNMSALDAQTGSLLWQSPIAGGDSFSSPAIANGILYFSTGAGGLHAFGLPGGN